MRDNANLIRDLSNRVQSSDRRIEPRVESDIPAKVKGLYPLTSTGPSHIATLVEISQRGMSLRVDQEFLPGASVQVFVSHEVFVGRVLHCTPAQNGQFTIGLELRGGITGTL
jgi:PilZ domain